MKRKIPNVFSLAFLDCMFCGFGAVILLFMIINHDTMARQNTVHQDRRGEVERLEQEIVDGTKQLVVLRNALEETEQEQVKTQGLARRIVKILKQKEIELARMDKDTLARTRHINALKADLKSLEEDAKRLQAGTESPGERGERLRSFTGQGDRQYLTGLKIGGKRIFILVDASASMLDETVVNIIRRRNLPDTQKIAADKWQQAVATVDWITTQLPLDSKVQIYTFNEQSRPVMQDTDKVWLDSGDVKTLNLAVESLRKVVPNKGTSLYHAFASVKKMRPRPDNIFLLIDGLPTRGKSKPIKRKVSEKSRLKLFNKAFQELPPGIPVNIILFPMEGDPMAASAYWKLAAQTRGSFINPSVDWP